MNFRTTILLLLVLVVAGAVYYITSRSDVNQPQQSSETPDKSGEPGKKLIDIATAANVNKIVVTPASGKRVALERSGASEWRLTEPVNAPAEAFKVDDLVQAVLDLHTTGRSDPAGKGFDKPTYVIEITDKTGKTTKLNVGAHSPVGDILYVRAEGQDQADVVSGAVVAQLEKPASEYRKLRLLSTPNDKITGVTVNHEGQTLKLAKSAGDWQIIEPKQMPGDSGQVSALLSAITGLDAIKFVSEDVKDPARYGLTNPTMTVTFTTAPPTTQPTTAQTKPAAGEVTTIKFGAPQDVFRKNLFATTSDKGPVVTVAATALDAFKKTPLDLRKREVLDVDANAVSRISIETDKPAATRPTTKPASKTTVVLERRSEVPATKPASTAPTKPAVAESKWLLASEPKGNADDTKVQDVLTALHPLKAEKFYETFPTTQAAPTATYIVKVSTRAWADEPAQEHELKIIERGSGPEAKLIGQLGDLSFDLDRTILDKLNATFAAPKVEPAGPVFAPPALPGLPAPK